MASLGHIAVGMAASRVYRNGRPTRWSTPASMTLWSLISFLPDADVVGFSFGVEYGDPWGHRGATHSLLFAAAAGALAGLIALALQLPARRTMLVATVVLASHGLLDTLTNGGLGSALFWPFDLTRYFAPRNPIPVAPIGLGFFSWEGAGIAAVELFLFAPLLWFALRQPEASGTTAPRAYWIAAWAVVVLLLTWRGDVLYRLIG